MIMKTRRVPLRKCTGCQEMKSKKELIRIVKNDDDEFFIDFTGKKSGRGAYVCPNMECVEKAHKNRGFERSFNMAVPKEIYKNLRNELEKNNE